MADVALPRITTNATPNNGAPIEVTVSKWSVSAPLIPLIRSFLLCADIYDHNGVGNTRGNNTWSRHKVITDLTKLQRGYGVRISLGPRYNIDTTALVLTEDLADYKWLGYLRGNILDCLRVMSITGDAARASGGYMSKITFTTAYPSKSRGFNAPDALV